MNILTDALPETVEIDGQEWPVNSDFRSSLRTMLAFEDEELTPQEKQAIMLTNLYPTLPANIQGALERARWFLNGGQELAGEGNGPRLYSFSKDANFIFAAFRQTHGIDLQAASMHWWQFLALFMDIGSDTAFCNLVSLRKRVKSGQATKEEKQSARELGDTFDVPEIDDRTLEERMQDEAFMRALAEGANKQ